MAIPQLRIHTEFTFGVTFGPVKRVAAHLKSMGVTHGGIVDPNTWGHVRWEKAMKAEGLTPLFGREFVVRQENGMRPVTWMLAEDSAAFYRFSTAIEQAREDRKSDEPFDLNLIAAHRQGNIIFSGAALFNPDLFDYIDLNPGSIIQQTKAVQLARKTGKPLVITSDNAYPAKDDADKFLAIADRNKATPQWLLCEEELRAAIRAPSDDEFAAAVRNTFEVAERAASAKLREAPLIHVEGNLRALAEQGRQERLAKGHITQWTEVYEKRLQRELEMIELKKFESYFLVVSDLVRWAKTRMLVGPGRGSSAGSLLCYLIGITEVDPLPHKLLFERFVDITRNDLPDIDIDFSDTHRDEVFDYLAKKYGRANVARIGNINTLKPRSVLAQVGKRMGIPIHATWDIRNQMIEYSSGDSRYGKGLEDTMKGTDAGLRFAREFPEAALMAEVEGHASHAGVHAAGVIVSTEPVSDYCTVMATGVAQIDKPDAERLNLLKIDALGLRTLGIIEDAKVVTADELYALKLDDPAALKVLNDGKFCGVFQFEGGAQGSISNQLHFDSFEVIDHATALARPGPLGGGASQHYIARKAGREEITYVHPAMEPIVKDTYGVVLYQEQVMRVVRDVGQLSWEETSIIRKAMSGRKGKEFFDQMGAKFVAGAATIGFKEDEARSMWKDLCNYGSWCVSGDTVIELPCANQYSPRQITIAELCDNMGFAALAEDPSNRQQQLKRPRAKIWSWDQEANRIFTKRLEEVVYSGRQKTLELRTESGKSIRATEDHLMLIPSGHWVPLNRLKPGDQVVTVGPKAINTDRRKDVVRKFEDDSWRYRKRGPNDGRRSLFQRNRDQLVALKPRCERCGVKWQECHHRDGDRSNNAIENLQLLCRHCHKIVHEEMGDQLPIPHASGRVPQPDVVTFIGNPKVEDTYDLVMPAPDHNFAANGFIVHNSMNKSHTVSYAIISYYCCFLKAHYPLQYAAACLRSAKDDDSALAMLRELSKEGVEYVPFDIDRSGVDWEVVDGKLIGGFKNLVGYGPVKAVTAVEQRRLGTLDREKVLAAKPKFQQLYPLHAKYGHFYADPTLIGVAKGRPIRQHTEMVDGETRWHKKFYTFICTIRDKKRRDVNEAVLVARRNGLILDGQTLFLDLIVVDDTGMQLTLRIKSFEYERLGKPVFEKCEAGDDLLVRGKKIFGFPMVEVRNMKCLNKPDVFKRADTRATTVGSDAQGETAGSEVGAH